MFCSIQHPNRHVHVGPMCVFMGCCLGLAWVTQIEICSSAPHGLHVAHMMPRMMGP